MRLPRLHVRDACCKHDDEVPWAVSDLDRPLLDIRNPVIQLYKTMSKEVPRVLTIYDADIPVEDVSASIPCYILVTTFNVH
jgi:hypothetical protein